MAQKGPGGIAVKFGSLSIAHDVELNMLVTSASPEVTSPQAQRS